MSENPINLLELFCGIGGLAACLNQDQTNVVAAVDINRNALEIYQRNFDHPTQCKSIESLRVSELPAADLWWMSPPCQPFTRRGKQLDLEDSRSAGFINVVRLLEKIQPPCLAMENVPEFAQSDSHQLLTNTLANNEYHFQQIELCPVQFGGINRRRRFYLLASKQPILAWQAISDWRIDDRFVFNDPVNELKPPGLPALNLPKDWTREYLSAIDVVSESQLRNRETTTACFTSAYGRSPVRSGSYLRTDDGARFFSPFEILQQLGFPAHFDLPDWPLEKLWPLTGNTLALPAVRYVLSHLPLKVV